MSEVKGSTFQSLSVPMSKGNTIIQSNSMANFTSWKTCRGFVSKPLLEFQKTTTGLLDPFKSLISQKPKQNRKVVQKYLSPVLHRRLLLIDLGRQALEVQWDAVQRRSEHVSPASNRFGIAMGIFHKMPILYRFIPFSHEKPHFQIARYLRPPGPPC